VPTKWALQAGFTPRKNAGIFYFMHKFFFANSEFIFAIRDPKSSRRDLEHTLETAQYRGLFFTFTHGEPKHYPAGPISWARFNVLPVLVAWDALGVKLDQAH